MDTCIRAVVVAVIAATAIPQVVFGQQPKEWQFCSPLLRILGLKSSLQ
jgi:hypothetical protein